MTVAEPTPIVQPVRCTFFTEDRATIHRVAMAAIDQTCAACDVDIALFESIEVPIGEALEALHPLRIATLDVSAHDLVLCVAIGVGGTPAEMPADLYGEASELIEAFFETRVDRRSRRIELVGSLR